MLNKRSLVKSILVGLVASLILLVFYFSTLTFVSGWKFASRQFADFWVYITSLAVGFGVQIGLYVYLKNALHARSGSGKVLAVSGTTSTVAMVSCCAHYLVNIVPALGVAGAVSFIAQYQIQLFWVGLTFNLGGIIFIARKLLIFKQSDL